MAQEIIAPKIRGFICTNAHPAGCAKNVSRQFNYARRMIESPWPELKALVIGASTGYGLATRVVLAGCFHAKTVGVFFERGPEEGKTASAGYYNSVAFHKEIEDLGVWGKSFNGDAFSSEMKEKVVETIKESLGKVDLVIYSLASPRRVHPVTGALHHSVIKPIDEEFVCKTVDLNTEKVEMAHVLPASEEEIKNTIAVMGGEDWSMWIDILLKNGLLNEGARTVAYSYIGPEVTWPIYKEGTIGRAKDDLLAHSVEINKRMEYVLQGKAWVAVNKAVVTQASAAIPVVPLYLSILSKVMKSKFIHEGCIEQMARLFKTHLGKGMIPVTDRKGRIRMDDWELRPDVQQDIQALWDSVTSDNLKEATDYLEFKREFRSLFGFEVEGVDYFTPVDTGEVL